ncbi:MAG TPA: FIST N-terminal domain-containing protein [Ideonella sp.]|uniref:FIST signal transduction protein n=1 Tax=Ideonella sp. TaxID=1929293 RepID=UPI002CFA4B75|nr:FIST N-terminal domain-containing protein [Ideonella sp.]HSI46743.1 FIST N-terminal domain-containing protein [Ideonella sp.]
MNDTGLSGFLQAHATHPDARMALALVAAQLEAQRQLRPEFRPTLALMYLTEAYARQAEALLADAQGRWPGLSVVGTVGTGIAACGVEYHDEPALVMLMLDLPPGSFQVFNGRRPLDETWQTGAWSALVHADPATPELAELLVELAERTGGRYLFGGLASARQAHTLQLADGVFRGGLSGVAFGREVSLLSRVTQGCVPLGPVRTVTQSDRNLVLQLDGQPALPLLLADLGVALTPPEPLMQRLRGTLAGLTDAGEQARGLGGQFGQHTRVRHLIGLDPGRQAVAVADLVQPGQQLAFCRRDADAARRDLVRICAELREEVEGSDDLEASGLIGPRQRMAGAVYISCTGRGGALFGGPSAELQIVRHALGEVPLAGFFAAGEIAGHHLYGYTGVLTVFTTAA